MNTQTICANRMTLSWRLHIRVDTIFNDLLQLLQPFAAFQRELALIQPHLYLQIRLQEMTIRKSLKQDL